jgi:ELMO domain-containing protein
MFDSIFKTFFLFARSLLKWFLHKYTSLCELQRIVYGCLPGAKRTKLVESSLELSKQPRIKQMLAIFDRLVASSFITDQVFKHDITEVAVKTVLEVKKISPKIHPNFPRGFGGCVEKIWNYKLLNHAIEELRSTPYDSCNFEHEAKLLELWKVLNPDGPELEDRISKQWQDIGFQVRLKV